jgi:hypothetical protein
MGSKFSTHVLKVNAMGFRLRWAYIAIASK